MGLSTAQKTTLMVAAVCGAIGAWQMYLDHAFAAPIAGGLALVLAIVGLLVPAAAERFHAAWMRLATVMGIINSHILLSAVYYSLFTPIGFGRRFAGQDSLTRRGPQQQSYWVPRSSSRQSKDGFERTF